MGNYSVEIAGFPGDEVGFSNTTSDVSVAVGESKIVSFDGTYLRTAGLSGQVSVEDKGLEGVVVSLRGGPDNLNETTRTDGAGQYSFARLRGGEYQVGISGYDDTNYDFDVTSQNVTLVLGETAAVDFEGDLLRTSAINGRASIDGGLGLDDVTVTLSGGGMDENRTTTTGQGGQYAFSGLAAGTYTVAISGFDANAYVFEETSRTVDVVDDKAEIVSFTGSHATTASISGHLFVDEATKNNEYDEGDEDRLPDAAGIVLLLQGPQVGEQRFTATDSEGNYSFDNLRYGSYNLVVEPGQDEVPENYGYGGDQVYRIALDVGQDTTWHIPFDITHQNIHFQVNLRNDEETGDALPDAEVALYANTSAQDPIATATTDDEGVAHLRFERHSGMGNAAYAYVNPPEGFDESTERQMVEWDAKSPEAEAENDQHVLNLTATFPIAGRTIETDMGGGIALAGWTIDVTHMDDDGEHEDVEGDVPAALDETGTETVSIVASDVADLPMTYYVALTEDQTGKDADGKELDGGEKYETVDEDHEAVDAIELVHTGLSTTSMMDTVTMQARYTSQTLIVYVHEEVDQIPGYTGTISSLDRHDAGQVALDLRHVAPGNRRATFDPEVWDPTKSRRISGGVVTYRHLPASANVYVSVAPKPNSTVRILGSDALFAFENPDENGIQDGAFGSEGGYNHTVRLCPLQSDRRQQEGERCGSFAYVKTYEVAGHVKKMVVERNRAGGFDGPSAKNIEDIEVSLSPAPNRNLAAESATAKTVVVKGIPTEHLKLGRRSAGEYEIEVSAGWGAKINGEGSVVESFRLYDGATYDVEKLNKAITDRNAPRHATDSVYIEVRPTTGTLYGIVEDDFGVIAGAIVTVNGVASEPTDADGRYIVEYGRKGSSLDVTVSADGYVSKRTSNTLPKGHPQKLEGVPGFAPNAPRRLDVELGESDHLATVTGTVTDSEDAGEAGVAIVVTGPNGKVSRDDGGYWLANADKKGCPTGQSVCRLTAPDGSYTLSVVVTEDREDYKITPHKHRMYFEDPDEEVGIEVGDTEDNVDFEALDQGRIQGSVRYDGKPLANVKVTADDGNATTTDSTGTTNTDGHFRIWVNGGERYNLQFTRDGDGYNFAALAEEDHARDIRIRAGQTHSIREHFDVDEQGNSKVRLHLTPNRIDEAGGKSTVTASLTRAHDDTVFVTITARDIDSDRESSFELNENTELKIAPGSPTSTGTVTITAKADDGNSKNDTIMVVGTVNAPDNVDDGDAMLIIKDDDQANTVTLSLSPDEIPENGGKSTVTARLDKPAATAFHVLVRAEKVTAASETGFTLSGSGGDDDHRLNFRKGDRDPIAPLTITAQKHNNWGPDAVIKVTGTVEGTDLIPDPKAVELTITDDGRPPPQIQLSVNKSEIDEADDDETTDVTENAVTISVGLSRRYSVDVAVTVSIDPTADATAGIASFSGESITIAAGSMTGTTTATLTAADDDDSEDISVTVRATGTAEGVRNPRAADSITVTIIDDDEAPGALRDLVVQGSPTADQIIVEWLSPDPTKLGRVDGEATSSSSVSYQRRYCTVSGENKCAADADDTDDGWFAWSDVSGTSATIGSLDAETEYHIQVRATVSGAGPGPASLVKASTAASE